METGKYAVSFTGCSVSCGDKEGNYNVLTVAWTGTICSDPAMVYISVRKNRYSHHMLEETGEFYINLTTEALAFATDYCRCEIR